MSPRQIPSQPVSVLLPVCNEADVIETVVDEWVTEVFAHLPPGSEMLIDSASTDGTKEILERLRQKHSFLQVHHAETKDGFAAAARRLYIWAKCPLVFFTDSDGQYVPSDFWQLTPYVEDYALVHGAKIGRKDSFLRKMMSGLFNRAARFLLGGHYSDINSAFGIIKRDMLRDLLPAMRCMPTLFNAELLLRAEMNNYPIKQVRIGHRKRARGLSRGVPPWTCLYEAWRAFLGLLALKSEFYGCWRPPKHAHSSRYRRLSAWE